MDTFLLQ